MAITYLDKDNMRITRALVTILFVSAFIYAAIGSGIGKNLPDPYQVDFNQSVTDTIPITDNYGDHVTDPNKNPFDITSNVIEQKVEYDPESGQYIIFEKIGEEYYRTPTYLTFEEYLEFEKKKQEKEYFNRLAGIANKKKGLNSKLDPMDRIDIQNSLVDRLFGGTEVNIQPQGQIDVTLQSTYFNSFQQAFGRTGSVQFNPIDPDVDISVSVDGNIGTKMNLAFNYDTQSTFDFDRKIKLEYDTEAFGEDDIIKKIEAGNVSLPLRGNLIQGAQSLFGLKTELQFGHLRLTAIASQQQSSQNNLTIENGAAIQRFEMSPDQYDENRHFFLSHYNRGTFEKNLSNLPQIATSFRISQLEVWVSNTGNTGQNYREGTADIVAISDLGEPDITKYTGIDPIYRVDYGPFSMLDPIFEDVNDSLLPDNRVNPIFNLITNEEGIEDRDLASSLLSREGFVENRDFEAFSGRRLTSGEYSFNEQLGFLSLNIRLRPNQALAVAYNYTYTANCNEVYNVGNLSGDGSQFSNPNQGVAQQDSMIEPESPKVLFTKLLKATNQSTDNPQWDLMMKNVYPLRASQLDAEGFTFDIFFEDDTDGTLKKFIPEDGFRTSPLLEVFNLDRLNRYNDPQADGIFDFVPGVTIIPSSGSVVFPVLEPFGSSLVKLLGEDLAEKYMYQELYDTSVTIAGFALEKNKFLMAGEVKSATSGEINLGPFVPEGSVRVRAGGIELVEGSDYEVDYSLGRLRIINDSYLQQGTPINVSFEDQALFSLQQKTMLGLRADYEFNDNFSLGATYLRLFERPFTEKVNIGNDPINNRIFGLDMAYSDEAPFITKMVDKLPFYSTKEASSVNFSAEAAYLKPGHSSAINNGDDDGGVVSIDDFEGAVSGLLLGGFNTNQWRLASTPASDDFPEAELNNDILYGVNRARTNWYVIDRQARGQRDLDNSYSRLIDQTDLFAREVQIGQSELITFDIGYYPNERGPYNFDVQGGRSDSSGTQISQGVSVENNQLVLNDPESRWGGIMRSFQNTDFEAANYEFIEFWMLNPYTERPDGIAHDTDEKGEIVFHLGNVSEDILKDGQQFFENSIPIDGESVVNIKNTVWGKVPNVTPISTGFVPEGIEEQDVGYDGLNNSEELVKFEDYVNTISTIYNDIRRDPCGDDYRFIESADEPDLDLLSRYKDFNNPSGNAPFGEAAGFQRGNRFAESEDLNNNKFLDKGESYYQYTLDIEPRVNTNLPGGLELEFPDERGFLTQDTTIINNATGQSEKWYRVRIPITSGFDERKNITGFRAIQFMKMYMTKFKTAKTFRLADFQLVRNLWRKKTPDCMGSDFDKNSIDFNVDEIGVEENGNKEPFGYVSPRDIKQERLFSTFSNLLQDEKSLALNFCDLGAGCEVGINKLARLDLTLYENLQLFFHAESIVREEPIQEGDLYGYIRFGKDLVDHYYEYEIPLVISDPESPNNQANIWPDTNTIDVKLENFLLAKKQRIENGEAIVGIKEIIDPDRADGIIKVKGTPSLGLIKVFEIGVRNKIDESDVPICGSVWVNELRATGLNEDGGMAAQARLQIQMADLGDVNVAANYSSIGWGSLDQRLAERNREELLQYDIATNLQLGKFFPNSWGINLPFYAQYSKNNAFRQFEPYERDLTVDDKIEALTKKKENFPDQSAEIDAEIADVKDRSKETTTIKTFNFTNVKKDGSGGKPWSISNFSASYSYSETNKTDPIIKEDRTKEYAATLDYNYSNKSKPIQPFKGIKSKALRIIKEFNFNPLPKSFSFSTNMNRLTNKRVFRLPDLPVFQFDDRRFLWDRNYGLNWDFTKSLKFNFRARSSSIVDELRQVGIKNDPADRDWVDERGNPVQVDNLSEVDEYRNNNIRQLGRNKNYNHNFGVQYTLPIRYLPMMDWINIKADYKAEYGWTAGALILIDDRMTADSDGTLLGNTIQNQQTRSLNGTFSFDKLYNKSKYLKKIEKGNKVGRSSRKRTSRSRSPSKTRGGGETETKKEEKKDREVSMVERILIRPLMSLRSIKATYKESFGTFIPGFMPEAELLGLSSGFSSPGLDFAAGNQPNLDNWLDDNKDWFNPSPNFNDEINQTRQQSIDLRINLEPFKDFDIDIDFKKTYRYDHTEVFKNKDFDNPNYNRLARYDIGSFEVSNMGLSTLFRDNIELYREFQAERITVSQAIGETGTEHSESWPEYTEGYGPNSYDVAVPAFLSTYVGIDASTFADDSVTIVDEVSKFSYLPKPNWTVKYDGLSKMEMFKGIFSSFIINHSYRGSMQVNRFNTTLEYKGNQEISPVNDNYFSRIQIPNIVLSDQFSPLIGISVKTKNDMTFEAEWRKSRQLGLALEELREQRSSEFRVGFGYTIKNFRSGKKNKRKRKRGQKDEEKDDKKGSLAGGGRNNKGGVNNNRGKTLTMNFDFSITDSEELIYQVSQGIDPRPNSGQRTVQIAPSVDYDINENLTMRFFFDYNFSESKAFTANSNMRLNIRGGVTAQLKIN